MGQWDNLRFPIDFHPLSPDNPHTITMKRRNTITHAAKVVAALHSMGSGESKSKREAAELTGIGTSALQPCNLANTAKNPLIRHLVRTDPLDITADVDGRRVSMREALSKGAESSVRTLARLAEHNGELTKAQAEQVRQCRQWLELCKTLGMFRDQDAPALPGELSHLLNDPDDGPDEGSVAWYLLHGNTHEQPAGMLRVIPAPDCIPSQDEGHAKTGKVDHIPFQPDQPET